MEAQEAETLKKGNLVWVWHNNQAERARVVEVQPGPRIRVSLDKLPGLRGLVKPPQEVALRKRQLDDADKPTDPPPWL